MKGLMEIKISALLLIKLIREHNLVILAQWVSCTFQESQTCPLRHRVVVASAQGHASHCIDGKEVGLLCVCKKVELANQMSCPALLLVRDG